jgi:hypothetical protein
MARVSFTAPAAEPSELALDHPEDGTGPQAAADPAPVETATDPASEQHRSADRDARSVPATLSDAVVFLARAAAVEESGSSELVGEYLGASLDDDVAVTAAFAAADRGYRGWYWSVTIAIVGFGTGASEPPTVSEVVLLPGEQALRAPAWVPWDQRIRAGDVGVGDLLATPPDDPRLVPGYVDSDDPAVKEVAYEFGLGRRRVLSREGRDDAAQRWHDGPFGPDDAIAQQAQATCTTCGFYVQLAGLLGMALGVCTNEYSPADGRVVDAEYGCGAHSDTVIDAPLMSASTDTVVDELTLEVHARPRPAQQREEATDVAPDAVLAEVLGPIADADWAAMPDVDWAAMPDVDWAPVPDTVAADQPDPAP